ncbi:MAG: BON domain-containing protein [Mariniblastus sp.]
MTMLNEHLEHHVNQKILAHSDLSSQRIEVTADFGEVTLHGKVQSFRRKLTAQEIAMSDGNVSQVHNELVVETPNNHSATFLVELVNRLLDVADGLSNESIMVSSSGNTVTISGYVKTDLEKIRVADIASSVDAVLEINNLLVVNPQQVDANRKHCVKVLEAISSVIGMENSNIRFSVVNEPARLSGWSRSLWMKDAAECEARRFGVLTLTNDVVVDPSRD